MQHKHHEELPSLYFLEPACLLETNITPYGSTPDRFHNPHLDYHSFNCRHLDCKEMWCARTAYEIVVINPMPC